MSAASEARSGKAPPAIHGAPTQRAAHQAMYDKIPRVAFVRRGEGECDGCGDYGPIVRGICAWCRLDGVPERPPSRRRKATASVTRLPSAPDNFPTVARERARALAIRAEDPKGWAEVYGELPATGAAA